MAPTRIALVCLCNICRSPTAHVVLEQRLADAGIDAEVASAGTGGWHEGEPMDPRSAAVLREAGYDPSRHRARTFTRDWFVEHDLLLAMDHANAADMRELAPTVEDEARVVMFRSFDPDTSDGDEVPDPWYGGPDGFRHVLELIERTCDGIVAHLAAR